MSAKWAVPAVLLMASGVQMSLGCAGAMVIYESTGACGSCECGNLQLYCSGTGGYCDYSLRSCGPELSASWYCY